MSDGQFTVAELQRMFCSRKFGKDAVRALIMDYGCFALDTHARVALANNPAPDSAPDSVPDSAPDSVPDTHSNARTHLKTEKEKREDKNNNTPKSPHVVVVDDGVDAAMVSRKSCRDWIGEFLDRKNTEYCETVCQKSGFSTLLYNHWTDALDIFATHLKGTGDIDMRCTESEFKRHFNFYVTNVTTGARLQKCLTDLSQWEQKESTDYMSTYSGPPLPDDAPPRPSHTAMYNPNSGQWVEPRVIKRNSNSYMT